MVRSAIGSVTGPWALEDGRHAQERVIAQRRIGQRRLPRQAGTHLVLAHHVLELDDGGGRPDVAGVDLLQRLDRLEDVRQLRLHAVNLVVGQVEAREVGDVLDVLAGDACHEPMVARTRSHGSAASHRTSGVEPCSRAVVQSEHAVMRTLAIWQHWCR